MRDGQLVLVRGMRGQLVLAGALEGEEARLGEGLERLGGIGRDIDLTGGLDGNTNATPWVFIHDRGDHVLCFNHKPFGTDQAGS